MKTDSLIEQLARGAGPAPKGIATRRLVIAATLGIACSAALSIFVIEAARSELFDPHLAWWKLLYAGMLAVAAGWLTARLGRPLARLKVPRIALVALPAVMVLAGLPALFNADPGARLGVVMGETWAVCPWLILLVSLPALAVTLWALRGLGPIKLKQAGMAAGLYAGALGALGYAIACPEPSILFVAIWYSLGVLLTGMVGRQLGPRFLRW